MGLIKKIQHFFNYWYVRYLLATELYMVETWEKVVVHVMFAILFVLAGLFNYFILMSSVGRIQDDATQLYNAYILS